MQCIVKVSVGVSGVELIVELAMAIPLGIEASEDTKGYRSGRVAQLYTHTLL